MINLNLTNTTFTVSWDYIHNNINSNEEEYLDPTYIYINILFQDLIFENAILEGRIVFKTGLSLLKKELPQKLANVGIPYICYTKSFVTCSRFIKNKKFNAFSAYVANLYSWNSSTKKEKFDNFLKNWSSSSNFVPTETLKQKSTASYKDYILNNIKEYLSPILQPKEIYQCIMKIRLQEFNERIYNLQKEIEEYSELIEKTNQKDYIE